LHPPRRLRGSSRPFQPAKSAKFLQLHCSRIRTRSVIAWRYRAPRETTTVDTAGARGAVMAGRELGFLIAAGSLYLTVLGFLTGMVVERMRFDRQRSEVLSHYEQALREWQTYRMALEKHAEAQRYPVRLKQADPLTNEVGRAAARTQADH